MAQATVNFERKRNFERGEQESTVVWHGAAFVMESLVLLFFLVVSLTIFIALFSISYQMGEQNERLLNAVTLATNTAEDFAADPVNTQGVLDAGDYHVYCVVTPEETDAGTLYRAQITVNAAGGQIYSLETSAYKSNNGAAGGASAAPVDEPADESPTIENTPEGATEGADEEIPEEVIVEEYPDEGTGEGATDEVEVEETVPEENADDEGGAE